MKGWISLMLTSLLLLGLAGCHSPVDTASTTATTQEATQVPTLPTTPETQPAETESQPTLPETQPTAPETQPITAPEPEDADFVRASAYLPQMVQELPYATDNNFTGQRIYEFSETYLRYGTVKKLQAVCEELAQQGLGLKMWDGFRPVSAQFKLWEILPDPTYVANPTKGFSSHSRGNTVDVTLVALDGSAVEMPTEFDDFSAKADRDYSDVDEIPAANARLLEETMERHGFYGYSGEWWHFYDNDRYPVEEVFEPVAAGVYYAQCNEFISLRTRPDTAAEVITRIPKNDEFTRLAIYGDFYYVDYQGLQGYVLSSYTVPVD